MRADLHTHTTASDGELDPGELVVLAAQRGLQLLAVSDHDTTAGYEFAREAGNRHGVQIVPAVELSTTVDRGEIHILGYGIDPASKVLQEELTQQRTARLIRAAEMIQRLNDIGYQIPRDVAEPRDGSSSIGRPHIARALIDLGVVSTIDEAFERFLTPGRPGFVPKRIFTPEQAIALVREAGGIPVLAHPYSYPDFFGFLNALIDSGLQGMEVYYGEYSASQRMQLLEIATSKELLPTGGSDFHGEGFREGRELGSVHIPPPVIERFLEAISYPEA